MTGCRSQVWRNDPLAFFHMPELFEETEPREGDAGDARAEPN
jgi:hypothetical protein